MQRNEVRRNEVLRIRSCALIGLLLGIAVAGAAQQTTSTRVYREGNSWIEESSGTLPAARVLRVDVALGSVHVQGGGSSGLSYTLKKKVHAGSEESARRQFEDFHVSAARSGDAATLRAEFNERHGSQNMSADFALQVPRELELVRVQTLGGGIGVSNITGRVEGETAGGGVSLENIGGAINANTMGGDISVNNAGADGLLKTAGGSISVNNIGGRLTANTYGGSLDIGTVKQAATLQTAGGSIHVRQVGGDLHASTAGGNVDAGEVAGAVSLKTAGGSIRLASARGPVEAATAGGGISLLKLQRGARAETAAGGITAEFIGSRDSFTDSFLESAAGDITVYIASNLACSVRAAIEMASGHKISSDFSELKVTSEGGDYGPKQWYAQGTLNGGGPVLKLRTSIGDIDIRRAAQK